MSAVAPIDLRRSIKTTADKIGIACCNKTIALDNDPTLVAAVLDAVAVFLIALEACVNEVSSNFVLLCTLTNPLEVCNTASPTPLNENLSCLTSSFSVVILIDAFLAALDDCLSSPATLLITGSALPPRSDNCDNSVPTNPVSFLACCPNNAS